MRTIYWDYKLKTKHLQNAIAKIEMIVEICYVPNKSSALVLNDTVGFLIFFP